MCGSRIAVIPLVFTIEESADIRPNITGGLMCPGLTGNEPSLFTGAFQRTGNHQSKTYGAGEFEATNNMVDFSAKRISEVYGASSTVQPISSYSLMIIKE